MNLRPSIFILALLTVGCASTQDTLSTSTESVSISSAIAPASETALAFELPAAEKAVAVEETPSIPKVHLFPGDDSRFKPDPKPKVDATLASGDKISLNFENITVTNLAQALLGELLQLSYTIDAGGEAIVSLHTRQPLPRNQVLDVLDTVLLPHDLVINRDSAGIYHVTRRSTTIGTRPLVGAASIKDLAGSGTVIVPLNHIAAAEMAKILTPLAPQQAITYVDSVRNLLVLQGSKSQISGWLEMVEAFDVDFLSGMSLGVFVLENANVSIVNEALQAMLGSGDNASPIAPFPQARLTSQQQQAAAARRPPNAPSPAQLLLAPNSNVNAAPMGPLSGLIRLFPIERLNALVVVTPRSHILEQVEMWIRRLDQPTDELEHSLFVYPVQNGSAVKMAEMLNGLFGGESSGAGVAAGAAPNQFGAARNQGNIQGANNFTLGAGAQNSGVTAAPEIAASTLEGNVRIVADASRNALMIRAPRAEYRRIERALRELDRAPAQVLIEASIVEVSLTGNLKYGVEWFIENHMDAGRHSGQALLNMNGTEGGGTRQPGFSYTLLNKAGIVRATLNALAASSQLKVLSNPSVLVLDNHSASIMVGKQQPIKTSTSISSNGGFATENITYKDTGVMLNVTPSVNTSGLITLDILQQVTDVGEVDAATQQRTFLARQIETRVAVRSGEPIVLGGVMSENESAGNSGVPGLRNIPLLGALFSSTDNTSSRTELLVMLTPRILEDDDALRAASHEMRQRMRNLTAQTRLTAPKELQTLENKPSIP